MSTTQKRWHDRLASHHHLPDSKDAPEMEDQTPWSAFKISGEPNARCPGGTGAPTSKPKAGGHAAMKHGRRYFAAGLTGSC